MIKQSLLSVVLSMYLEVLMKQPYRLLSLFYKTSIPFLSAPLRKEIPLTGGKDWETQEEFLPPSCQVSKWHWLKHFEQLHLYIFIDIYLSNPPPRRSLDFVQ